MNSGANLGGKIVFKISSVRAAVPLVVLDLLMESGPGLADVGSTGVAFSYFNNDGNNCGETVAMY